MSGVIVIPDSEYSARDIILEVVKKHPSEWFEPKAFSIGLKKANLAGYSPSYINNTLNTLVNKGTLEKEKRGRRAFFRLR